MLEPLLQVSGTLYLLACVTLKASDLHVVYLARANALERVDVLFLRRDESPGTRPRAHELRRCPR